MGVRHRYIDRRDWTRPVERTGRAMVLKDGAYAYRTDLLRLRAPGYGQLQDGTAGKIADDGWCWLTWMRPDYAWALTAMRDENGRWVQFYFDIVSAMGCDGDGRAWFEDCWLDIVAMPDGRVYLLDEDELEQALTQGETSENEAEAARKAAGELMEALPGQIGRLECFMERLYCAFDGQTEAYDGKKRVNV